jgi:hypothetical protein
MKKHGIVIAICVFVLIIFGMFMFAFLKKSELATPSQTSRDATTTTSSPYDSITRIDAKHFFKNGTHTLVGQILMPTACDLLNWGSDVAGVAPEQVTVKFDVINNAETCAQAITQQRFKVEFTASETATIKATLEGRAVELNLIPAGPDESPDDFELFIKG